jgi:hydrophobe/amphiphile efflux-1 (HAE1) family protein
VQRLGVITNKASPDLTMVVHLVSPGNRYDTLYLSNYALLRVKDELARLDGVGDVQVFGAGQFSMRIWLDPEKVASRGLTADDVVSAIREQNIQVAAGQLGAPPLPSATEFQVAINVKGRLTTEDDFRNIIVKTGAAGQVTRLKDVARVELGADSYALRALLDNQAAAAIPIFQRPGSNAIAISESVRAKMQELKRDFPQGVDYQIVYDPTVFVRGSIHAVVHTLIEAILLVVLVVIVFLQTWRASVIPLIAVPVSLVGTFAVMHLFGFSLNALSLFGLVLAIGIVVDDAIVVVENVERNITAGLTPIEATRQAMREVTGPIIATALVLCAVFVPTAFISGLTGQFYKQFALTIAISTVISAFNSLTLSPALSALLLQEHGAEPDRLTRVLNRLLGGFFRPFNRFFARFSAATWARWPGHTRGQRRTPYLWRPARAHLLGVCAHADRLRTAAGQAVSREFRAAPRRSDARSHRVGDSPHGRDRAQAARRRACGRIPGLEHQRLHQQPELRHRVRDAQALRAAQIQGTLRGRDRGGAQSAVRPDPRRVHRGVPAAARDGPRHDRRLSHADRGS